MAALAASLLLVLVVAAWATEAAAPFAARMVHRLSDEARAAAAGGRLWPSRGSREYSHVLVRSDQQRQARRLRSNYQTIFPAESSEIFSSGNDLGWLYYTWIDIGTPNVSFLVALDSGSDLLWVPCDCIQCASANPGILDRNLGIYDPSESSSGRHVPCSHELCMAGSSCQNPKQACPYNAEYHSENTTSLGVLIQDILHLVTREGQSVQATVIFGCGRRQSGSYLEGIAPDGVLGLGFGDISVPSFLSRAGLVRNSFSMCFRQDDTGRILFGDQGVDTQQSTPFVPLDGKLMTYVVEVENFCVGHVCLGQSVMQVLIDSGTSFTFLPSDAYLRVTKEFDRQVNAKRVNYSNSPWEYCYSASSLVASQIPSLKLNFALNRSFLANDPIFRYYNIEGAVDTFCLAVQQSPEAQGIIGQNFLVGYNIVFDREKLQLGWYPSNCHDLDNSSALPLTPPQYDGDPDNPLPTIEQQNQTVGSPVTPAVAGKPTANRSASTSHNLGLNLSFILLVTKLILLILMDDTPV